MFRAINRSQATGVWTWVGRKATELGWGGLEIKMEVPRLHISSQQEPLPARDP